MIQHVWSVLCQSPSFDVETNSVSLLNVLESIIVPEPIDENKPILLGGAIVSLWSRENRDVTASGKMRMYFVDPSGNRADQSVSLSIEIKDHLLFYRTRINLNGLPIHFVGKYVFYIEYQDTENDSWQQVAEIPFWVLHHNMSNEIDR